MSAIKNISLFIPHVFPNFTQKYVAEAFAELGHVDRVDFVAKQDRDGKPYNAVYIHFKRWYTNGFAIKTHEDIIENRSVKFYHDESEYYWIVLPNTAKKHVPGERKPRIDLGESKSVSVKNVENTPEKPAKQSLVCPGAPKKPTYTQLVTKPDPLPPAKLEEEFDQLLNEWETEEEAQMAEIEAELEAEDENLVSIDWRYIQAVEQENMWLHTEVAQLRIVLINLDQIYQAEKNKVTAFSSVETSCDL